MPMLLGPSRIVASLLTATTYHLAALIQVSERHNASSRDILVELNASQTNALTQLALPNFASQESTVSNTKLLQILA